MKRIAVMAFALTMAGCASIPQPMAPVTKAQTVKQASKPAVKAVVPTLEAKPPTFKERWFDRFMKHKKPK